LGFQDLTVLDISETAIEREKSRLRVKAKMVKWITEDIRLHSERFKILFFVASENYNQKIDLWKLYSFQLLHSQLQF
ncbi:MAG: hypothetical protein ACKO7P_06960, partial [Bacteroidota bacterium]